MSLSAEENRRLANISYHRGDTVLESIGEASAVEGTNYCNIKCIMCPRGEPDIMTRSLGHMSKSVLETVIEKLDYYTEPVWLHWFGEPLMNTAIFDNIAAAKKKAKNVGISTNATLLRPAAQKKILESGLDTIMIAIDGATKEVYERVRKSDRFGYEQVVANATQFLQRRKEIGLKKPHVILSLIEMTETAEQYDEFRRIWIERGADEVLFKPFTNWAGQDKEVFDHLEVERRRSRLEKPRPHPCKLLWQSFVVAWDGRVVPCCYDFDAKMVMGDLKTQTVAEIWNSPAYVELRQAELEGRNNSPLCANCSVAPGHARNPEAWKQADTGQPAT